jgi:ATP-dependent protease ClpP protease subunit
MMAAGSTAQERQQLSQKARKRKAVTKREAVKMNLKYRNQKNAESIAAYWKKPLDKPDWYSINDLSSDTPEIYIYDVVGFPYTDVGQLLREMATIKDKPILARINSPGGDVWDGVALMNGFANHPGGVTVRIESLAASIASVIAMGGRKVEAYSNALLMIHNSWVVTAGNRVELLEVADILEMVDENIMESYAKKTKLGKKELREMMAAETWLNAKAMKEKGFIDEIIQAGKGAKAAFDLSIFSNLPDEHDSEPVARKYEKALRDVGASKNEARTILARGLKSVNLEEPAPQDDEAAKQAGINELKSELNKLASIVKR